MRIVKLIIISIVALLLIITIVSLFIPSNVSVAKAIQIYASKEKVMEQLSTPLNWKNWYPGSASAEYFYQKGVPVGLIFDKKNEQYIIISEKKSDEVTAAYILSQKRILTGWKLVPAFDGRSVTVQWYMTFHLRWYPWEKFSSFMFEKVYNPQLKAGLENLKAYLEK